MPCRCKERREWITTRIVDPVTGKLVRIYKAIRKPTMSLTERLKKIESDIAELKQQLVETSQGLGLLLQSLEDEEADEEQPERTLDGEAVGGERDQSREL